MSYYYFSSSKTATYQKVHEAVAVEKKRRYSNVNNQHHTKITCESQYELAGHLLELEIM